MEKTLIKNGRIVDGTGAPYKYGDILVQGDEILAMGRLEVEADRIIDAKNHIVAPGFIDLHTHSDIPLLVDPRASSKLLQGVTTEVLGNCGGSPAPLGENNREATAKNIAEYDIEPTWNSYGEYLAALEEKRPGINAVGLVGHSALRSHIMGFAQRESTDQEKKAMGLLLERSMEEGAWGFSSGLQYTPSGFADVEELVELGKVAAGKGGLYSTHMRDEAGKVLEAIEENIEVGRQSEVPVQISHLKAARKENWPLIPKALELLSAQREAGLDITCEVYPYVASSTGLDIVLPAWAHDGGQEAMLDRLRDTAIREELARGLESSRNEEDFHNLMISYLPQGPLKMWEGKRLDEIARGLGLKNGDCICHLILESGGRAGMVHFSLDEGNVKRILQHPLSMVISDGSSLACDGPLKRGKPHPRNFGTFPRVLGHYVRKEKVLRLEEAVYKMTGMPAWRLGLPKRGLLKEGFFADITIFDPQTIEDRATFTDPYQYPRGIKAVLVNGTLAVWEDALQASRGGRVLRKG